MDSGPANRQGSKPAVQHGGAAGKPGPGVGDRGANRGDAPKERVASALNGVPHRATVKVPSLLRNDPIVWVLMRAVFDVKDRGEAVVLGEIAEMVDRGMWESAWFWATAVDNARHIGHAAEPGRMIPPLDKVLEHMATALSAYRKAVEK